MPFAYFSLVVVVGLLAFANSERYGPMMPSFERKAISDKEFPYHVSLRVPTEDTTGKYSYIDFCSGAIVGEQWVLTSASCFLNVPNADEIKVVVSGETVGITKIHFNETQNKQENHRDRFDVALVKLEKKITGMANATPIKIASPEINADIAILSGYSFAIRPVGYHELQTVPVGQLSDVRCRNVLNKRADLGHSFDSTNVCYKSLSHKPVCIGDTGSPLVVKQNGIYELVGIFSWTLLPCEENGDYAVYEDATAYRDWLAQAMEKEDKKM